MKHSKLKHFKFSPSSVVSRHLTEEAMYDVALVAKRQTMVEVEEAPDTDEEFRTPGQDMSSIVQEFLEEHSQMFENVLLDENVQVGKVKEKNFKVVVNGSRDKVKGQELYEVFFLVYDNQMLGH